jgi:hypothetical protein
MEPSFILYGLVGGRGVKALDQWDENVVKRVLCVACKIERPISGHTSNAATHFDSYSKTQMNRNAGRVWIKIAG